jgi:hypothetical protein
MKQGIKHLIQCHCILPQYKKSKDPIFHQFIVFSILDESDTLITKFSNCDNCGATHKIFDVCQSEIMTGKEDSKSVMKISDFKLMLPSSVYDILIQYEKQLADFEYAHFILEEELWNSTIILSKEELDENLVQGKLLKFISKDKFRMESYSYQEFFEIK